MLPPPIQKLTEEVIATILSLTLDIPATKFRSSSPQIWGENDHVSTSQVLLVSKQWLRIGTPLLYGTVVIRSSGQAHALADVLQSHPDFGRYIKQVRLEGAYSRLDKVFKHCENLETLFLRIWDIASTDEIRGLCRSLKLINPQTVILDDKIDRWGQNDNSAKLFHTLCRAIPVWTRLVELHYPYVETMRDMQFLQVRRTRLLKALSLSPSLQRVHVQALWWDESWTDLSSNHHIQIFFNLDGSLKNLIDYVDFVKGLKLEEEEVYPPLKDLVFPTPCPRKTSDFTPMANAPPDTVEFVWKRIFAFVLFGSREPPGVKELIDIYNNSARLIPLWTMRKGIENVCSSWRRVVQILTIKAPMIGFNSDLAALSAFISAEKSKNMGSQVELFSLKHMANTHFNKGGLPDTGLICSLIPRFDKLRYFEGCSSISLPVSAMEQLSLVAGGTLISFGNMRLDGASGRLSPQCISRFTSIDDFEMPKVSIEPKAQTTKCLATLTRLTLVSSLNRAFFNDLALPSLQTVRFLQATALELKFLDKHGSKIIQLDVSIDIISSHYYDKPVDLFRNCSALKTLTLRRDVDTIGYPKFLQITTGNASLEKIEILGEDRQSRTRWRKSKDFVQDLRLERFPNLREIHFPSYQWPTREHEIDRHHLIKLSRELRLETEGRIDVTDSSGKPFRERVQPRTNRQ